MDFELTSSTRRTDSAAVSEDSGQPAFEIANQPLIPATRGDEHVEEVPERELPRSYGTESLSLMVRDPRTLFAYWDIDWEAAFRDGAPADRKVHLRILNANGSEHSQLEVEPMAQSCSVPVSDTEASYRGELGWFKAGEWISLASSEAVMTPADSDNAAGPMELTTIPFHMSFQRMLDLLRVPKHEQGSLVSRLRDLRARAETTPAPAELTAMEDEVIRALEEATYHAGAPPAVSDVEPRPIKPWNREVLSQFLGFTASSPAESFGGSSWTSSRA